MKFAVSRHERIFDDLDIAIVVVDQQGVILLSNHKAQEWLKGLEVSKKLSDFHESLNQKTFKAGDVIILPMQTIIGTVAYYRMCFVSHYGEKSKGNHELLIFIEDITEMRKDELFKDKLLSTISQMYEMKDTQMLFAYLVEQLTPFFDINNLFVTLYDDYELATTYFVGNELRKTEVMPAIARWLIHQHSFKYYDSQSMNEINQYFEKDNLKASTFMGMPITANGKSTLGVMGIYSNVSTGYSSMQQSWLITIGEYLGIMIQGIIRDQRIKGMNRLDQLTALPNRNQFYQQLEGVLVDVIEEKRKSLAIYHMDLGGFKNINSTYGHILGDQFLKAIADKFYDFQKDNMLIARLGGDEFIAYYVNVEDVSHFEQVAQKLIDLVREPILIDEVALSVTSNIGISILQSEEGSIDELLQRAYDCLMIAKKMGPDTYYLVQN